MIRGARELPEARVPGRDADGLRPVADDLAFLRTAIVNVYLHGPRGAGDRGWVLVDTGLHGATPWIARAAERRFGHGARPAAIVLTHGHFDHVGTVRELAALWEAPVYAHPLELPHLTGRAPYPPPDPGVGGGAMAALSRVYPRGPVDLGERVHALPADGSVPGMPEWRWIHTPGHTEGHVSLFRERDRCLIAGDAFVTTKQESALAVLTQRPELHGPPAYFTPDWEASRRSVRSLADLEPEVAATGHGVPLRGPRMREALHRLASDFDRLALPARGRYVPGAPWVGRSPAGSPALWLGLGAAVLAGALLARRASRRAGAA